MTSKIQPDQFLVADLPVTRTPGTSGGTATKKALIFFRLVVAATGDYIDLGDYLDGINSIEGCMYYTSGDQPQPVCPIDAGGTSISWTSGGLDSNGVVSIFGNTGTARVGLVVEMS